MSTKISLRKKAIELFLNNVSPSKIANELKVSRSWVYKWVNRYKENPKGKWFEEQSKTPKQTVNKTPQTLEDQIVNIRKQLEHSKYAQVGAVSIQYEFVKLGLEPPPVWTINRVIKRNKLTRKGMKKNREKKVILRLS